MLTLTVMLMSDANSCRSGAVISLAEPKEEFVGRKLAKRLDVEIPLQEVAHGGFRTPVQLNKAAQGPQAKVGARAEQ